MGHRQTLDLVDLLDINRKVTVVDCDLGRTRHELDEKVHLLLVEGLDDAP